MRSLVRLGVVWLLLLATSGIAEADPVTCAAGDPLGTLVQDDAGSGTDASNVPDLAQRLAAGDFTGTVQLPSASGPGDAADWYAMEVDAVALSVMVDLQQYLAVSVGAIVVDVYPPGAETPAESLAMDSGRTSFDPAEGRWSFQVRFLDGPGEQCSEQVAAPVGPSGAESMTKNYALYVGCDPVCV